MEVGNSRFDFSAFVFDDGEKVFGGAGVFYGFTGGVDGLEVVILGLEPCGGDGPAALAVFSAGEELEELIEAVEGEGLALGDLDVGEVVVPDGFRRRALGEEEEVGLGGGTGVDEEAGRE